MIILIHFIFSTMAPSCQSESPMSMSVPFAQPTVGDNLCKSPRHWVWPKNVKKLARHSMFVCTSFVFLCNIYVGLSRPRVLASDDSDVPGFLTQPANSWALPRLYMWKSPMALLKKFSRPGVCNAKTWTGEAWESRASPAHCVCSRCRCADKCLKDKKGDL